MKVAFHFDADHERFDRYDGLPVLKEIFFKLLQEPADLYVKIFTGNIDTLDYLKDKNTREEIKKGIFLPPRPVWQALSPNFIEYLYNHKVFVVAFEGIGSRLRDQLHSALLNDDTYLGAQQIHEANPIHWLLYGASVIPMFRIYGNQLCLLYSIGQEFEWDRALVTNRKNDLPFESILFEEVSVSHTILDTYSSYEHASRVANLSSMLYDHLNLMVDQLILTLTQLAPDLYELMQDTLVQFEFLEHPQGLRKASEASGRLLDKLAQRFSSLCDNEGGPGWDALEQMTFYIQLRSREDQKDYLIAQLRQILAVIDRYSSAEGLESDLDSIYEGVRLLMGLIVFVGDMVSLSTDAQNRTEST